MPSLVERGRVSHMFVDDFAQHSKVLHIMTADFARAVPDERWDFTPVPPGSSGRPPAASRLGDGFGPFSKQLRHVVCVRGVHNDALATGKLDWSKKHEHYTGPLEREPLLDALEHEQQELLSLLAEAHPEITIDWDGFPFSLAMFAGDFVQHEAIHHGQWSVYAAVAGFDTPLSWRQSWKL
ncbi:hypothetical protein GCM10023087_21050 [Microbacterium rhizosphaerae]